MKIKYLKYLLMIFVLWHTMVWADMIVIQDDDGFQYMTFENCFPDSTIGVIVYRTVDLDSIGFVDTLSLVDSLRIFGYQYGYADRDGQDRWIPGHYEYNYWVWVNNIRPDSTEIVASDTSDIQVNYDVTACGGLIHVD